MKYVKYWFLITILMIMPKYVNASCTDSELAALNKLVSEIKITFEYDENNYDENGKKINGKYILTASNLKDEVVVELIQNDNYILFNNEAEDGTKLNSYSIKNINSGTHEIGIFGLYTCPTKRIKTINVAIPKYNIYSEREECQNIDTKKFSMCDKTYQFNIEEEYFQKKLMEYKKNLEKENEEKEEKPNDEKEVDKEKNTIIEFLSKYYIYIIIGLTVIVGITYIIVRRRKEDELK